MKVKELIKYLEEWDGDLDVHDTDLDDDMSYELGNYIEKAKMPLVDDIEKKRQTMTNEQIEKRFEMHNLESELTQLKQRLEKAENVPENT